MSMTLSAKDQTLSPEDQALIQLYKQQWQTAKDNNDTAGMEQAHANAEAVRGRQGYSGGADGSGALQTHGKTAAEVRQYVDDFTHTNYDPGRGWVNGYSVDMNKRSLANYIRQQMQANSDAWAAADPRTRDYLHQQNLELAGLLEEATGGARSVYNEKLGRWETDNANLGYGYNVGQYADADIESWYKGQFGMTDEQIERYRSDTDRYYNFVDQSLIRNLVDESSGYTGAYAQFRNGPYGALLQGTAVVPYTWYKDVQGDGFRDGHEYEVVRNPDGTVQPQAPVLKQNALQPMDPYTMQFYGKVNNGVIGPSELLLSSPAGAAQSGVGPTARSQTVTDSGLQAHSVPDGSAAVLENYQAAMNSAISAKRQKAASALGGNGTLEQWQAAAAQQTANQTDYAVNQAVQQLLRAQEEANSYYQTQRDQIAEDERKAMDNAALYAELRGDRGGIGQAQYSGIQATAAANRHAVNTAQVKLATDTARQIADLRAQGEFEKADNLLSITQTYLLKLLELEQWAAEFGLSQQQFMASLSQWQQEFNLRAGKV